MVAPVVAAAAVAVGKEVLMDLLKIATSPGGLEWIGRHLADRRPALKKRIAANEHVPVAKEPTP